MCVCVCQYVCESEHVCTCVCVRVYLCVRVHVCESFVWVRVCVHVSMGMLMTQLLLPQELIRTGFIQERRVHFRWMHQGTHCLCACVRVRVYRYMCVYVYMSVYVFENTCLYACGPAAREPVTCGRV